MEYWDKKAEKVSICAEPSKIWKKDHSANLIIPIFQYSIITMSGPN
jgi:hypothetical protein